MCVSVSLCVLRKCIINLPEHFLFCYFVSDYRAAVRKGIALYINTMATNIAYIYYICICSLATRNKFIQFIVLLMMIWLFMEDFNKINCNFFPVLVTFYIFSAFIHFFL